MFRFCQTHGPANRKNMQQEKKTPCIESAIDLRRPAHPQRLVIVTVLLLVLAWVTFTHWPALSAQASSFDDEQYLHKNPLVQNPSWSSTWRFLSEVLTPSTVDGYYQPLAMISLMLDHAMGGRPDNLVPFHVSSLCLHVLNTLLVILLLYALFGNIWPAVIAGLLFGSHPLTVEPIPWISERKTLLASFFALWCMIIYVRYAREPNRKLLMLCGAMYILALMSKPTTTPLPVLLLLLDFWPLRRLNQKAFLEKMPLFAVMIVFAFITIISQGRTASVTMPSEYSPTRIPLILCHNIVFYLFKIVRPVKLSSHYPFPEPLAVSQPMILAGVIGTCILLTVLLVSLRWTRALLTGWLFFFVAILPTMGIIGFTNVVASDKYAYLPSVGFLMVLARFLDRLWPSISRSSVRRIAVASIILVIAFSESVATRRYLAQWQDSEEFHRYMLALAPDSPSVHLNLANIVLKKGRSDEAISHYQKAIAINTNFVQAHFNLGVALFSAGRYAEAIREYRIVLRFRGSRTQILFRLADALARDGQVNEAINYYEKALEQKADDPEILNNLALALVQKGDIDTAIRYYNKSLEVNPDSVEVLNNLGNALVRQHKFREAIIQYEKALSIKSDFAETHYNLANALKDAGDVKGAALHYREAITLRPNNVDTHYGLGMVLAQQKDHEQAAEQFQKVIDLDPNFARAYYNLGLVFYSQNQIDKAIEQFRRVLRIHPKDADMHCNLGVLLFQKGSIDDAIEQFNTALNLAPNHARAKQQLEAALQLKNEPVAK